MTFSSILEQMQDITCVVHSLQDPYATDNKDSQHALRSTGQNKKVVGDRVSVANMSNKQHLSPVHNSYIVPSQ